ncbi:GntR family transcriptional regulator [Arthrobacter alpinus]|uniref:GntR family transcriptional regulator n=1 Tax=Arthrobacter alpinus TaxID=656366 RepID=A0A0S2M391_9MICC|nr:GntR family transcriptional regulator [Arthrobacter alpinus]ALO68100.1 GntR family transcriptional regulator [Arthrobacter alpinus]
MSSRQGPQLSEKASAHIRGLIMSGELRPGTSVRPEVVGEELGISTTPAREALQALRVEGFLDLVPGRGFQVSPLTGQDIRDIFRVQALIGGELAARAAEKASDHGTDELEALHHELIAAAARKDHALLEEKNHAFHREINLMADSRKIIWVLGITTRYVPREFYASIPGWPQATMEDHAELLLCIKSLDPDASRTAMQEHIIHAGELLATHFDARVAAAQDGNPTTTAGV